jgi:rhamnose utilization protein RhaD (predicted bifunctional aldolase and dehydrogenase)
MNELIKASRYIGSRFDLVQSGGGNSSVKEDGFLYVKSSGTYLGDMTADSGVTKLKLDVLQREIQALISSDVDKWDKKTLEDKGAKILQEAYVAGKKSSIETFLHASFKKYVLHTHPIAVTYCMSSALIEKVKSKFNNAFISEYKTPGIELLIGVKEYLDEADELKGPVIIFLKNHGLVVSADTAQEALDCTNAVCDIVSGFINFDISSYKEAGNLFNVLSELNEEWPIVSLVQNSEVTNYIIALEGKSVSSFCPDIFIYLGWEFLDVSVNTKEQFRLYEKKYQSYPSVFIKDGNVYIQGPTYKKTKEIEDVLLCYIKVMEMTKNSSVNNLEQGELQYLSGWEAEKYRKNN